MKTLILTILLSFSVQAFETCNTPVTPAPSVIDELIPAMDAVALMWWSVSPSQYENAVCKAHTVPDYDAWFGTLGNERRRDKRINGYRFEDQPQSLLDAFKDLTKNMDDRTSSCTDVLCAVDEVFGAPAGRKLLYIRARHGYNSSHLAFQNTRQLTETELNDILITLSDLPPDMMNIGRGGNQRMALAAEGVVSRNNPRASADAAITFYDRWRTSPDPFNRRYGLFHEFGHNISEIRGNLDDSSEWRRLMSCQVSTYGNTNNKEDFTESLVMYRFNGRGLLEKCPEKYAFLKERAFGGREYLDESQCN